MSHRQRWYGYLNEPSHKSVVAWIIYLSIAIAIFFNMTEALLVSVDDEPREADSLYLSVLFTLLFLIDYLVRVWVAADAPEEHGETELKRRLRYVSSPMGIIDLMSFLPGLVLLVLPESNSSDMSFLKLLAIIRILKLTRYSSSLTILAAVYRENFSTLLAATVIMILLSFTAATGVYIFEKDVQPDAFGSIPSSMWWALVTLTTVGYGDIVPITLAGKLFGSVIMIAGVGIAAIPAGIFASSFVRLIRERERDRRLEARRRGEDMLDEDALKSISLSKSEKHEAEFLIHEYGLTLEQAVSVIEHYRGYH
ncbi:hypothetical protein A3715_14500 [Oleiphilus sp. HI0009]|uniref:ion transporter n=2 Tax=Oleiphilus TaxID=141450 RepID=UPI0007C31597|nr:MULTISPECIES: ion transporter [unclassified Oleiphilus]KZX75352.1 hypothetical protein A3715_14500 [Oleiphilus sp. HI0009]KZY65383.1 hypothetical protein A3738_01420 [Oleiphilus sp. HI0066]KZY69962.1 hypothetical protein A3739_07450 [Oleiphilus sp. HI0067]